MTPVQTIENLEAGAQRAEDLLRAGHSAGALRSYVALLEARLAYHRQSGEPPAAADLVVMERTAEIAARCGEFARADDLLHAMFLLSTRAKDTYGVTYIAAKRAQLAIARGDLLKCRRRLGEVHDVIGRLEQIDFSASGLATWEAGIQCLEASRQDRTVLFADLYLVVGQLLAAHGRYGDALTAFERGKHHAGPKAPDRARRNAVPLALSAAAATLEAGDTRGAEHELASIAPVVDAIRDPGHRALWLETRGRLSYLTGALGAAVADLEALVELCSAPGLERASRAAHVSLAQVYILLNHTAHARTILASVARSGTGDAIAQRAAFLARVALARSQPLAEGVPLAPAVIELWRGRRRGAAEPAAVQGDPLDLPQASDYLSFFEDRALAFQWALAARDPGRAAEVLLLIERTFASTDSKLIHARLAVLRGLLAYYQGEFGRAEALLRSVVRAFEVRRLTPELWQLVRVLRWCAERLGRPREAIEMLRDSEAALADTLSASLKPANRALYLLNKWSGDEEIIAGRIDALVALKRRAAVGSRWLRPFRRVIVARRLSRLCDDVDERRDDLTGVALGARSRRPIRRGLLSFLDRLLGQPWRTATVSFLVLPDRVVVIRSALLALDFGIGAVSRLQLRDMAERWHRCVRTAGKRRGESIEESSSEGQLGRMIASMLLIDQVESGLGGRIRTLRVVPDDILHGVPFAALVSPHLATTVAFRTRCRSWRLRRGLGRGRALLVGVSRAVGSAPPLPGVPREIESIGARFHPAACDILLDDAARREVISTRLPHARIAHFACHGLFTPDRPDASGLLLLPSGSGSQEMLTLRDLAGMKLSGLRHVTLSSCWSADSLILPGRHVVSLPETLWHAGVGSVLGSLWPVSDAVAVPFMGRFYELLRTVRPAEALRRTQEACRSGKITGLADANGVVPRFYWAGFVLHGDDRRFRFMTNTAPPYSVLGLVQRSLARWKRRGRSGP